jgi:hypothetical protein
MLELSVARYDGSNSIGIRRFDSWRVFLCLLNAINQLIFVMVTRCFSFPVRTEFLNII